MAWKKLTAFLVVLLCRFVLFLVILSLSWMLLGKPNTNTSFLTVFISFLIPLPQALYFIEVVDRKLLEVFLALRADRVYNVGSTVVRNAVLISFPRYIVQIFIHGWLDSILGFIVNNIRLAIPNIVSKMIWAISRTIIAVVRQLSPWLLTLITFMRSFSHLLVRTGTNLLFRGLCLLYRLIPSKVTLLVRWLGLYPAVFALFLCLPSLEILPNVLLTGNFYPGSLIRFQRCAMYDDSTACHATFLEFSYTLWNITRTVIFILVCWNMNGYAWKQPERDFICTLERCLMLNDNAYVELLLCAAAMPVLLDGHCVSQTVHNTFCVLNLLLFIITFNGYHRRTVVMAFYALCGLAMNVQSVFVALYNIYTNLQTQRNTDLVVTLMYFVELYLTILVLLDCSTRVISKVCDPKKDIMAQDG
ncbi:uncharacterized protein [Montipora capricornis]|uniref:uncharacterized protein isoform X2 n=1 Tax=Montipora foliosa TaxID=591990 RepID=UPI0035F20ECA